MKYCRPFFSFFPRANSFRLYTLSARRWFMERWGEEGASSLPVFTFLSLARSISALFYFSDALSCNVLSLGRYIYGAYEECLRAFYFSYAGISSLHSPPPSHARALIYFRTFSLFFSKGGERASWGEKRADDSRWNRMRGHNMSFERAGVAPRGLMYGARRARGVGAARMAKPKLSNMFTEAAMKLLQTSSLNANRRGKRFIFLPEFFSPFFFLRVFAIFMAGGSAWLQRTWDCLLFFSRRGKGSKFFLFALWGCDWELVYLYFGDLGVKVGVFFDLEKYFELLYIRRELQVSDFRSLVQVLFIQCDYSIDIIY